MKTETIKNMPVWKYTLNAVITAIIPPVIILSLAGDWQWTEGWIFCIWFDIMVLSNSIYLYIHNPELLADRASLPGTENQKKWDKYLMIIIYLLAATWFILMPLDASRFALSPNFPLWIKITGGILLLPSLYLEYQSAVVNAYLSTQVKILKDRKHKVVTTGIYSFVRHPKYLGDMLMMFGAPMLMGSLYAIFLSIAVLPLLIFRIYGEEKMLMEELEGYNQYQKSVKFRLVPFIW